jgi:hypothetical protein
MLKKIILLVLIFNLFFLTDSYSQKNNISDGSKVVNVSCSGTGEYGAGKIINWIDNYEFFWAATDINKKKVTYSLTRVKILNCSHCFGRDPFYWHAGSFKGSDDAPGLHIKDNTIIIKENSNNIEFYTTISMSSGNFQSIDKIKDGKPFVLTRRGTCTNMNKFVEYQNLKPEKSISSPNKDKETDTGAKDLLKKIIGK